jgi:hypothetical protein
MATLYVYLFDEAAGLITIAYFITANVPVLASLPCPLRKHFVHIDISLSPAVTYRSFGSFQTSRS